MITTHPSGPHQQVQGEADPSRPAGRPTIERLDVWVVNIPLVAPFQSSFETKVGETRTVVRILTSDGVEGWGETMWGAPVAALVRSLGEKLIGTCPWDLERFRTDRRMIPFFHGYLGYAAMAAIDMACWDALGRTAGISLTDLLGGRIRERIGITALVTRADVPAGTTSADLPRALAEHTARVIEHYGFGSVKLKGTNDPVGDVAIMTALRERLPDIRLRVDPNAAWTVDESIRAAQRLADLDLEYLEDPCTGLEQMAYVRARSAIPLCTNMCVVRLEEVAPAVRLRAVDVIHGDVIKWGSIQSNKALGSLCEAFGLGMNLHSGGELGIATAAHLAIAASTPALDRDIDSMYYLHADDVVAPLDLGRGGLAVPTGPGLGVEVDDERLARYAALNAEQGDLTYA